MSLRPGPGAGLLRGPGLVQRHLRMRARAAAGPGGRAEAGEERPRPRRDIPLLADDHHHRPALAHLHPYHHNFCSHLQAPDCQEED